MHELFQSRYTRRLIKTTVATALLLAGGIAAPGAGALDTEVLQLHELWRVGGDDEDNLLGRVLSAQTDEAGSIYLFDAQLCQVTVYSPDGRYERTLFGAGDGPGEVRRPFEMVLPADGSVGLVEEFPGKIVRVDRAGSPLPSLIPGGPDATARGQHGLASAWARADRLVLSGTQSSFARGTQTRTFFLASFTDDGTEEVRYLEETISVDFTDYTFDEVSQIPNFALNVALGPDGRLYAATERERYSISVFNPDGSLDQIIERDTKPWRRTTAERHQIEQMISGALREAPFEVTIDIADTEPVISWRRPSMHVAADGSLWVLPTRGFLDQPQGILFTYDVFDADGQFRKQVAIAGDGDGRRDALFFAGDGRAILIKGYDDALRATIGKIAVSTSSDEDPTSMEVICYAIGLER